MSRSNHLMIATIALLLLTSDARTEPTNPIPRTGTWRAWLDSPGGELPFGLELSREGNAWQAWIINGDDRIDVPSTSWTGESLILDITHYDAKITARYDASHRRLTGEWKKRGKKEWTQLPFHATYGSMKRFEPDSIANKPTGQFNVSGQWRATFSSSEESYVAKFQQENDGRVTGTIMTPTGDYGFLEGTMEGNRLRLSVFDGAHAFLFDAKLSTAGQLTGDFWSRDKWHETWTATRDPDAALPDAFKQTKWTPKATLGDIAFPDLEGSMRSLDDPAFRGNARILMIFGSWCPNCYDASKYLTELHGRYGEQGLSILGIAFELTDDPKRNAKQVKKYVKRHGIGYPVLVAGFADTPKVAQVLPVIDKLRSYPTTIFLDGKNKFRAIHTGFTGPATGDEYTKMRNKFESIINEILAEQSK